MIILSINVYSFTPSQHISLSLILEKKSSNNFEAFTVGFISHAIADSLTPQHYTFDIFNPPSKEIDFISLEGFLSIYQILKYRDDVKKMYAVAGSLAPDIIEAIFVLLDKQRWYNGNHFFPWHDKGKRRQMSKEKTMLFTLWLFRVAW